MAELVLQRQRFDAHATLGELTLDGERLCYTLEDRPPRTPGVKEPGVSRIPAGTHPLGLRTEGGFHQRYTAKWDWHGPMVEILLDGWKWVLFHTGNYHTDSEGCVLVGESPGEHEGALCVWKSTTAYTRIYPALLAHAQSGGTLILRDEAE